MNVNDVSRPTRTDRQTGHRDQLINNNTDHVTAVIHPHIRYAININQSNNQSIFIAQRHKKFLMH